MYKAGCDRLLKGSMNISDDTLIRFETANGEGILMAADDFLSLANGERHFLRSSQKLLREIETNLNWIRNHTTPPPRSAYSDDRSRSPCTWFKSRAKDHIR